MISTPGHKYYLPTREKWTSACELHVGDIVLLSSGKYATVEAVRAIRYDEAQTTYNFEVEESHTYFVGTGVCVHNRGSCGLKPSSDKTAGPHSTFKRDPSTGKITHYATYKPNPLNPSGFDEVLRFDGVGAAHNGIPTPHIHNKSLPGGCRPAFLWEIPGLGGGKY